MQAEIVINKIVITAEAVFDYEEIGEGSPMPKPAIKNESEFYIDNLNNGGRLTWDNYFRAKYYDEQIDKMLMLFFYRGERFGKMQLWKLFGICVAEDWSEELEDGGQIRYWLNSKIDLTGTVKTDWVLNLREAQKRGELGNMPCFRLTGLPKEVSNAIYSGTDKEISERLSHLQRKGGKWVGYKRYLPKHRKPGKVHKCT